ncbi:hypothetical protein CHH28_00425 [Bacterioplanes sanyensis]|uniref:Uncharacterized protein n=1 Tax=Bacterioplanes sanyensis TaxID=1249553 RepID=A0A222FFQ0_9GAMM|nr:hypothetical protein [Bacterioplanes sanyensis]ASP37241.1 hypothetical protein CHH28_00425 [Bacterioplanes sanyensis]
MLRFSLLLLLVAGFAAWWWSAPPQTVLVSSTPEVMAAQPIHSQSAAPATQPPALLQPVLANVAVAYELSNRYPDYSLPLAEHQVDLLQPNRGAAIERDLNLVGLPGSLLVQLDAFRYRQGDPIQATVVLSGGDDLQVQVSSLTAEVQNSAGETVYEPQWQQQRDGQQLTLTAEFDAHASWPQELLLAAQLTLTDRQDMRQTAPFRVFDAVAEITGTDPLQRGNNELLIPVRVARAKAGFYKLSANVYIDGQQPLAHLQGKARIGSSGVIPLKLHGSLLAGLPSPQRLSLHDLQLRRIPVKPGNDEQVEWGYSQSAVLELGDVATQGFYQQPYQDEQIAQRLQFLQQLGTPAQ